MKPIFNQTIKRMFRMKELLVYFSIILIPVIIDALISQFGERTESLNAELYSVQSSYFMLSFLWLAGVPFIINLVAHGTGLFASEEAEGTMTLLVIKPVQRYEIVLGKTLGLFVASMMYQIISIILSLFIYCSLSGMDTDSVRMLLNVTPGILLYAALISFFFTAVSSAMSIIFKKKIAGIIIALLFVFAAYGIIPAIKGLLIISGSYEKYFLHILDFNYHFGLLFKSLVLIFSGSYSTISAMENIDSFTGNVIFAKNDMDIINIPGYVTKASPINYISPVLLVIMYIFASSLLFAFVFYRMNNKDLG